MTLTLQKVDRKLNIIKKQIKKIKKALLSLKG